jgi:hypothetical protein
MIQIEDCYKQKLRYSPDVCDNVTTSMCCNNDGYSLQFQRFSSRLLAPHNIIAHHNG